MRWLIILLQLVVPVMVTIYTVNFGRWMSRRKHHMGAIGAYAVAAVSMLLAVWSVMRNSV